MISMSRQLIALGMFLLSLPADAQVFNVLEQLSTRLQGFGKFTVIGRWDGNACALTGIAPPSYLLPIAESGTLPKGITIEGPATVLRVGALASDRKTFQNCNAVPSTAQSNFSASVTRSLSVALTSSFSTSVSGSLSATAGTPGVASVALGISGSNTWGTSTTNTQTTAVTVVMGNAYSTQVGPNQELDISYTVFSKRTRMPVSASGVFDASIYPCQIVPAGKHKVSDFLSVEDRTFAVNGIIEFDDVQEGVFEVSAPRTASCPVPGVRVMNATQ